MPCPGRRWSARRLGVQGIGVLVVQHAQQVGVTAADQGCVHVAGSSMISPPMQGRPIWRCGFPRHRFTSISTERVADLAFQSNAMRSC